MYAAAPGGGGALGLLQEFKRDQLERFSFNNGDYLQKDRIPKFVEKKFFRSLAKITFQDFYQNIFSFSFYFWMPRMSLGWFKKISL